MLGANIPVQHNEIKQDWLYRPTNFCSRQHKRNSDSRTASAILVNISALWSPGTIEFKICNENRGINLSAQDISFSFITCLTFYFQFLSPKARKTCTWSDPVTKFKGRLEFLVVDESE